MKLFIQVLTICSILCFTACAADSTAEAPVKETQQSTQSTPQNNAVTKSNTQSIQAASNTNATANNNASTSAGKDDPPPPELKVGNYTGSTDMEAAKKGINAGTASKLGLQMGGRYCKCNEDSSENKCKTKIINTLESMKKSLHPKIAEACEKAFLAGKSACE